MSQLGTITKGTRIIVTSGAYSDYSVHGVYVAAQDIDLDAMLADWLLRHPEQKEDYCFQPQALLAEVQASGALQPLDLNLMEWYLDSYANTDEMTYGPWREQR